MVKDAQTDIRRGSKIMSKTIVENVYTYLAVNCVRKNIIQLKLPYFRVTCRIKIEIE